MKQILSEKEIMNRKFTNDDFTALSVVLCYSPNIIKTIYNKFSLLGLNYIAMCNTHFRAAQTRLLTEEDKNFIQSVGDEEQNRAISHWMEKERYMRTKHNLYYFCCQNEFLGYDFKPQDHDINYFMVLGPMEYGHSIISQEHTTARLKELLEEASQPLQPYIEEKFKHLRYGERKRAELYARLINLYLRHSTNMIGVIPDVYILSNAFMMNAHSLKNIILKYNIMVFDYANMIFYDPELRRLNGMSPIPTKEEIGEERGNYNRRVNFWAF